MAGPPQAGAVPLPLPDTGVAPHQHQAGPEGGPREPHGRPWPGHGPAASAALEHLPSHQRQRCSQPQTAPMGCTWCQGMMNPTESSRWEETLTVTQCHWHPGSSTSIAKPHPQGPPPHNSSTLQTVIPPPPWGTLPTPHTSVREKQLLILNQKLTIWHQRPLPLILKGFHAGLLGLCL